MKRSDIVRLSLVRFSTSFLVVLLVGVLNRIMIVELGIARTLVGMILSLLHLVTPLALFFGFLSDTRPIMRFRRVPYILLGMFLVCLPMPFLPDIARNINPEGTSLVFIILGITSLLMIGFGITISTIALHALIVDRCSKEQKGEAMTLVWIITLVGYIIAAPVYSVLLPSYDPVQLRLIFIVTAILTFILTLAGVFGIEKKQDGKKLPQKPSHKFGDIFRSLSKNPHARLLFIFIALADFFFFSQEYVLESFGEEVFKLSVAHTTTFSLYMGAGILLSMIAVNSLYTLIPKASEKTVIALGCIIASLSFSMLALSSVGETEILIMIAVFTLGVGKGMFNVGIARIMVKVTRNDLSGTIMGLWAVIGGLAIGLGELVGAAVVDATILLTGSVQMGYGLLFIAESAGLMICLILIIKFKYTSYHQHLEGNLPAAMSPEWE